MTNARHTHTQAGAGRGSGQRYILSGNSNNGDRWGRLYARSHFSFSLPAHNSTRPCKRTDMSWELNRRRINVRWPVIILSVGKLCIANEISKNPDLLLLLLLQSYTIREKKNTKLMSLFLSSLTIVCSQLDQITHHRRIIINLTANVKDENNIWVGSVIFFLFRTTGRTSPIDDGRSPSLWARKHKRECHRRQQDHARPLSSSSLMLRVFHHVLFFVITSGGGDSSAPQSHHFFCLLQQQLKGSLLIISERCSN